MQTSVSSSRRHNVSGAPISLLKFPSLAIVLADGAQRAASRSLVEVLPIEPVIPTTRAEARSRTARPIAPSVENASSGTSVAAAPRAKACLRKSAPRPTATKRSPSAIRRESTWTPVTSEAQGAPACRPGARAPVAAATEDADTPIACELMGGRRDVLEGVRLVRVIDDDREGLACFDRLEPAGDPLERLDPCCDLVVRDSEQPRDSDGREHVFDIEAAAQPCPQLDSAGPQPRAAPVELELLGPDVGLVDEPEGQEPLVPERAQLLCEPAAVLVADVDGGRRPLTLDEEPALRGEVALEGPVEIEVVLAEVGERERGEADTVEPPKLGAVRGRLQRAAA